MSVDPDKQGFADAQRRLRDKLGMDITFYGPIEAVYDPSVAIDPETNQPYDPMIAASASTRPSASVRCSIVQRPFTLRSIAGEDSAEGWGSQNDIGLIMSREDGVAVGSAVEFDYSDHRFSIRNGMFDGIGEIQRFVIHGQRQS